MVFLFGWYVVESCAQNNDVTNTSCSNKSPMYVIFITHTNNCRDVGHGTLELFN